MAAKAVAEEVVEEVAEAEAVEEVVAEKPVGVVERRRRLHRRHRPKHKRSAQQPLIQGRFHTPAVNASSPTPRNKIKFAK